MALPHESQGLFEKHQISVHYSGLGTFNASSTATKLAQRGASAILNLGTCGSHTLAPKTLVQCRDFVPRAPKDTQSTPLQAQTLDLGYPWVTCGTGDHVETKKTHRNYEVMDMEGYAIARVCTLEAIPFYAYKYITDSSDEDTRKDWLKNLNPAAHELYECFVRFQNHLKFTLL